MKQKIEKKSEKLFNKFMNSLFIKSFSKIDKNFLYVLFVDIIVVSLIFLIIVSFALKYGSPILIPSAFASDDLEIMHPSLFERTTTGFLRMWGLNNLSQDT